MKNLTHVLDGLGLSQAEIRSAIAGTRSAVFTRLSPSLQEEATMAITNAMSRVYILSIAASAITVICAMLMKKEKLFPTTDQRTGIAGGA
jgi:uncharacterized protein YutE (UPF0331/DUF86 family)